MITRIIGTSRTVVMATSMSVLVMTFGPELAIGFHCMLDSALVRTYGFLTKLGLLNART